MEGDTKGTAYLYHRDIRNRFGILAPLAISAPEGGEGTWSEGAKRKNVEWGSLGKGHIDL